MSGFSIPAGAVAEAMETHGSSIAGALAIAEASQPGREQCHVSAAESGLGAAHTPGRTCDVCEGYCIQSSVPKLDAGVEISLRIGQRVRHRDYDGKRVIGVVRGLSIDSDRTLQVDISLDAPIVVPPISADDREIRIWSQHVPAYELEPFDGRDEVISDLLEVAQRCCQHLASQKWCTNGPREALPPESVLLLDLRAAIAKTTGSKA